MFQSRFTRSLEENPGARAVRTAVFMEEQGYKNEFDELDAVSVHLCLYDGDTGIACARAYPAGAGKYILGRVAVRKDYRGQRLGSRLVTEMEDYLRREGAAEIELSAQLHAMKMYAALGYAEVPGSLHDDEGQPHMTMTKRL